MANTFVDPHEVAGTAIALVRDDLVLASTVSKNYAADFGGGRGSSVDVRIPATLSARTRALGSTSAITLDDLTESVTSVTLDEMAYSAVRISDEDLTLSIVEFGRQVLAPQTTALGEFIENKVVAEMQGVAEDATIAYDAANPVATFVAVRKKLRDLGVPQSNLVAAVGTQVYADLLEANAIRDASQSGSSDALRNANAGMVSGFLVVESNRLAEGEMVFYHRDAITLVVRAPVVPDGASFGASVAGDGFALRWLRDYDSTTLADRSIVSTFIGTQVIPLEHHDNGATNAIIRVDSATIPI